jgi:2-hydroxymuconate-semialdehyde hydrolase
MTTTTPRERMLAGLPATRSVDVDGMSTSLIEAGDGPPLLLLHGGIECAAPCGPGHQPLARHHRVVVPEVPALGQSAPVPHLDVDAFNCWLTGIAEHTSLERPTVVAHSLVGSLATRDSPAIGRLIVYAAPGVGPYRMPLRLRSVAIRFAIRPTPRNAERFDRLALLDLDATRQRDPDWYDAFETCTRTRARDPDVKKTMRRLIVAQTKPIPDAELDRIDVPITLLWPPRPYGPAPDRRSRRITPWLAPPRHRPRRPRPPHRTTRSIRRHARTRIVMLIADL